MEIKSDIIYVGCDDLGIDLFEGQYVVPNGISYNSYVCFDEKIAVFDTVDGRKTGEWLNNLDKALTDRNPDYLIINHMEPDHSASVAAFLKKYPDCTLVGNDKTFIIFARFFPGLSCKTLTVKEGDELSLGKHVLTFLFAPMVHWPEVMLTFDKTDKVLFSADAFGKFGALSQGGDWTCEARRYYFNIVGKYGATVQSALKKVAKLGVKTICPLHGPVLKENLEFYIKKYDIWSSYKPEDRGVLIAYASIYGNTKSAAEKLAEYLKAAGEKVVLADLARCDMAEAIEDAFRYDRLVVAAVTLDAGLFPAAETFINELKAKNYRNRTVAIIENGSWAPAAGKIMRSLFGAMNNVNLIENTVTVNSAVTSKTEEELKALAEELIK